MAAAMTHFVIPAQAGIHCVGRPRLYRRSLASMDSGLRRNDELHWSHHVYV